MRNDRKAKSLLWLMVHGLLVSFVCLLGPLLVLTEPSADGTMVYFLIITFSAVSYGSVVYLLFKKEVGQSLGNGWKVTYLVGLTALTCTLVYFLLYA